jgi:hypothetical protein
MIRARRENLRRIRLSGNATLDQPKQAASGNLANWRLPIGAL